MIGVLKEALKTIFNKRSFVIAILLTKNRRIFYAINDQYNCAEINAMRKARTRGFKKLLVCRIVQDRDGNLTYGIAQPCPFCSRTIIAVHLAQGTSIKIWYTVPGGLIETVSHGRDIALSAQQSTALKDYQSVKARREKERGIGTFLKWFC